MSDPLLDPAKLADALKSAGVVDAVKLMLHGFINHSPLTDEQKAALNAEIDRRVLAIVQTYGPEVLNALKDSVVASLAAAVAAGKGPISDDQSGFA